ncbi:hypothetical protein HYS94_00425 [Candidatus Daviesbacteria bacterium]|nr:hypothetical protein [Candidatus Daviesbacteria bacterium]
MDLTGTQKQREDLIKSFRLLDFYLNHFEKGKVELYLPMATELNKLLCDSNTPLVVLVIGDVKLPRLYFTKLLQEMPSLLDGLEHFMPGKLSFTKRGVPIFNLVFSQEVELIDIKDWLNQIFFKEGITIRELIKSVRDKEAAHSDPDYNEVLKNTREWLYGNEASHILGIYGISRLLFDVFKDANKKENIL